ncbi:chromosome partitioning protein [Nitratiruptor tergarcus DSM 16512]|uniref:Chromosome partitioning protein n=1 Tax=Nitratiruptor tergarcus DSM 16512 TaxID=1069081 RepID=A0A1W1WVV9_9BACT|nr:ParA family protein [Nitratiruptor tergarcus]SMC10180.1 chromosome partitioning protein [Nitratiruptor tergarcus DSM 16512]
MANITICNFKGGVGKSLIAHQLITSFGYKGVEIDPYGSLAQRLPQHVQKIDIDAKAVPEVDSAIFDFGGFDDIKLDLAIQRSELVIIPFIPTLESVQGTVDTLNKVKLFDKPILMVANMVQKPADVEDARFVFTDVLQSEVEIFSIPLSIALQTAINENKSIIELANQGGIRAYIICDINSKIIEDLNSLIQLYTN